MPLVMVVNPSFPAKTIPEFIAYAKANSRKISMASAGTGGTSHVAGELFNMMTGVNMLHVPYRGGAPAMTDLIGGQVQVFFGGMASIEYIRSGKLRGLAVTTATRSEALPDLPTLGEFVPTYEVGDWFGVGIAISKKSNRLLPRRFGGMPSFTFKKAHPEVVAAALDELIPRQRRIESSAKQAV